MKTMTRRMGLGAAGALLLLGVSGFSQADERLVGEWDTIIGTPMGNMSASLIINADLSGEMRSAEMGATALANLVVNGEAVSFSTDVDAMGTPLTLYFSGNFTEAGLSGSFDTDFGPLQVRATRR